MPSHQSNQRKDNIDLCSKMDQSSLLDQEWWIGAVHYDNVR